RPESQVVPSVVNEEDDWPRFTIAEKVVEALKTLLPLKVLLLARSVVDATVIEPPTERACPLMVPRVPVRRLVPMVLLAMTLPLLSNARREDALMPVSQVEPVLVSWVVDALANCVKAVWVEEAVSMKPPFNVWRPVQVFRSPSNVELAAVMVIDPPL